MNNVPPLYSKRDFDVLRRGFQEEYIDPHNLVSETIAEIKDNITKYCENPALYVAPYTSLVTSSMMGKSRLMKEIAHSVPSVYMCLRPQDSSGYPHPTPILPEWINQGVQSQIRNYKPTSDPNFIIPTFKFAIFLLCLLKELSNLVEDILCNHPTRVSDRDPYLWMWEIFAEPESPDDKKRCENFWANVVNAATEMMKKEARETKNTGLVHTAYSYLRAIYGTAIRDAYANLKKAFCIFSDKDFNLLLIFDEARTLCDISAVDGKIIPSEFDFDPETITNSPIYTAFPPFSNFRALRRAECYLTLAKSPSDPLTTNQKKSRASKKRRVTTARSRENIVNDYIPRIFALLTDTSARLTNFQPPAWEDRSLRLLQLPALGRVQFEPIFTFTSIDAHSMYSNELCTANINSVAKSMRLLKFGRAGWYSMRDLETDPVSLAIVKLVGGTQQWSKFFETLPEEPISAKNHLVLLAVLAPRLALNAGPCVREASEIIASHLAILMRTDDDRHFLKSAYASEPILAEASAKITQQKGWGHVLRALYRNIQTGIVEGGFRGELLSKIFCLMAVDKSQPNRTRDTWQFTRPVKVSDFLNNFIQPPDEPGMFSSVTAAIEAHAKIFNIDPVLIDRFLNGHVFFNHFIKVEEHLTLPLLVQAWNRGAALMCKPCVEAIDHVIPIILAPEPNKSPQFGPLYGEWNDAQIDEARRNVSYILINSRNYAKPRNHDKAALKMIANEGNIKFSLNKDGTKSVLELNILQEFGRKQPRKDLHNVKLLNPESVSPQHLTFVLKDISAATYKCLESLDQTPVGKMTLLYLDKLREAKADYDDDLVTQKKFKRLAARHESLPIVFGATSPSSMSDWNDFRERMRDD
jgi:hypothetical protein